MSGGAAGFQPPKPISEDISFQHIDSLPVPGVGQFELYLRNSQVPRWILAKRLDAQKRPQQADRVAVFNKIASNFPNEVTAANSDYKPLAESEVTQKSSNLFADPRLFAWNYFEHAGANLLEVTNYFTKQGLKYSDSDLFAISGFLIDAGRKLEDVLGHHSLITQSSLLVKPNGKLSLLNPLVSDTQINDTETNLVAKIIECGPAFTQEMYLTRDARKAAEKNDQRIKSIGAWHRGQIMSMIDHSFVTLLSLAAGVDDKIFFKDAREFSQDEVSRAIDQLRKQGVNSLYLDFLQHVLLQQAYDSFKKLSQYVAGNVPLQNRIQTEYSKNVLTSPSIPSDPSNNVVRTVQQIQSSSVSAFAPNPAPLPTPPLAVNNNNVNGTWSTNFMTQASTTAGSTGTQQLGQNQYLGQGALLPGQLPVVSGGYSTESGRNGIQAVQPSQNFNQQGYQQQVAWSSGQQGNTGLLEQFSNRAVGGTGQTTSSSSTATAVQTNFGGQQGGQLAHAQNQNQQVNLIGQFLAQQQNSHQTATVFDCCVRVCKNGGKA